MLLSLDEMSDGLRRESHPTRVVFLCLEIVGLRIKEATGEHSLAAFGLKSPRDQA